MTVYVKVLGFLQEYAKGKHIALEGLEGLTVRDLLVRISSELADYIEKHPENVVVLLNGTSILNLNGLNTLLKNGDHVTIMPVISGGAR